MIKKRLSPFIFLAILLMVVMVQAQSLTKDGQVLGPITAVTPPEIIIPSQPARYIIQLEDAPLAVYASDAPRSRLNRLDVDNASSQAYRQQLAAAQTRLLSTMSGELGRAITPLFQYEVAFNGLTALLTADEARAVAYLPGVTAVYPDTVHQIASDASPAWIGAPALWDGSATIQKVGSQGEGIVIGVIDTGINFTHPSFAATGGDGYEHQNPLGSGNYLGWCNPSHPDYDTDYACNDKLIGAWDFIDDSPSETDGPQDNIGHGSHVASIAAGNMMTATMYTPGGFMLRKQISGVAPHANLIVYDACYFNSCPGSAVLMAVEQAVKDGVDVLNLSVTGGTDPYHDPVELALLAANEVGIVTAAAAGNAGPAVGTVAHQSPWVTAVAASSTNRQYQTHLTALTRVDGANLPDLVGKSLSTASVTQTIVYAGDFGNAYCDAPFSAGTWNGDIVVCDRGGTGSRTDKGVNVQIGGASGLVLVNGVGDDPLLPLDQHVLPAIHLDYGSGLALKNWLAVGNNHQARITATTAVYDAAVADQVVAFSSRGPADLPLLKPDVAAPGVEIFAAELNRFNLPNYGFRDGTSMAAPHYAGAAALLKDLHPAWTADEIRSALALTSKPLAERPFTAGAGRIDLTKAALAGFTLDESYDNYWGANPAFLGDVRELNVPNMVDDTCFATCSWTRTVHRSFSEASVWTAKVTAPTGLQVSVNPPTFTLGAGSDIAYQTFTVTVTTDQLPDYDAWVYATVAFSSPGQGTLHMPVAVKRGHSNTAAALTKTAPAYAEPGAVITYTISLDNLDFISHTITLTDSLPTGVRFITETAPVGLTYITATHQLVWQGELPTGAIDYTITKIEPPLPYHNLADSGVTNLCDQLPAELDCDDGYILLDLESAYSDRYTLFGESLSQLYVSANGIAFGPEGWQGAACPSCPQPMPHTAELNQVIAPLWRDIDLRSSGGWYAGVLSGGLLPSGARVLYINWDKAPQLNDPTIVSSHALAIVLDGEPEPAGRIYYIYGEVSNADKLLDVGYAVGIEDKSGTHGLTYGFAPCVGDFCLAGSPIGNVPEAGTTLRLDPVVVGGETAVTVSYQVAIAPETRGLLTNTVMAVREDGVVTAVAVAETYVGYQLFLPAINKSTNEK